jgi:hypothetical protein
MTVAATQMASPVRVGRLVADSPPVTLLPSYELLLQQPNGTGDDPGVPTVRPGAVQPLDGGNPR